jgi:hypothetical protein
MAGVEVNGSVSSGLGIPEGSSSDLHEAAKAVRTEYQASVRWKKFRCWNVIPLLAAAARKRIQSRVLRGHWRTWDCSWQRSESQQRRRFNQQAQWLSRLEATGVCGERPTAWLDMKGLSS